jgi:glycosyltransferase involved in cell wall biosynthesis
MLEESLARMGASELPRNVVWHEQLKPVDLRAMYARCQFVVIPLHDVSFDAGYTATVEAMSMGRPVIISRTQGQVDLIEDGVQGLYVPVGDAGALQAAMQRLLASPGEVQRMGAAGRKLVEERYGLERYVRQLVHLVREGRANTAV